MASHQCKSLVLLCLLVVWNSSPIGAEVRKNADLEDVEDAAEQEDPDEYVYEEGVEDGSNGYEEHEDDENERFDETDVVVLGSNNFTTFVANQRAVFVQFHAPWCLHCAQLAPHWAAAATALKGQVVVAKVDDTSHGDISEELRVDRYPTLLFFLDGVHSAYNGDHSKDAIVNYVTKKMSRSVRAIMSVSDAESVLEVQSPIAVAYLKNLKGPEVFELTVVARQQEGVAFFMTSNDDVASRLGFEKKAKPVLGLIKKVPEERTFFKGTFKRKALHDFVSANKLPLVILYKRETASLFFDNAISKQVLCFVRDDEYWGYAQPLFEEVARAFRGQALFVRVSLSDQIGGQVAEFYGVMGENPIVIMAVVAGEDGPKYFHEGEFIVEGIKGFIEGFLRNKLRPYYKSQAIPEPSTEDVQTAVGKNFEEVVLDEAKDTLLELYSPWCYHCQDLEPMYQKLAKALKIIPSISIVKMDGVANEHPRAKVDGFPTILLYPANRKRFEPVSHFVPFLLTQETHATVLPRHHLHCFDNSRGPWCKPALGLIEFVKIYHKVKFDGEPSVKGLYQFLKKHAAIPFELPKHAPTSNHSKLKEEL